jgi:hypothetical protein
MLDLSHWTIGRTLHLGQMVKYVRPYGGCLWEQVWRLVLWLFGGLYRGCVREV